MITRQQLRSWVDPEMAGWYVLDVAAAGLLSVFAVLLTSGVTHSGFRHGGVGASIGVLAMTAPVAWRRRAPVSAAAVLAAGAVLNGVVFGSMVRCGAALPAVFLVAYALGIKRDQSRWAIGLGLCWINVAAQAVYDPKLGAEVLPYMLPIASVFYVFGRVARSRTLALESLQRQTVELRRQREETARMSVAADRSRLSEELDRMLLDRIDHIAVTARAAQNALAADPAAASEALVAIEHEGRDVLGRMRQIVGSLDSAPSDPQPTLAELPRLLQLATTATTRLSIDGDPRRLPAGLELSGYRIIEHLLLALDDAPGARVDVRLCFEPDTVELHVRGPASRDIDLDVVLAAARERAGLHRGTLDGRTEDGRCHATARLPLVSSHA